MYCGSNESKFACLQASSSEFGMRYPVVFSSRSCLRWRARCCKLSVAHWSTRGRPSERAGQNSVGSHNVGVLAEIPEHGELLSHPSGLPCIRNVARKTCPWAPLPTSTKSRKATPKVQVQVQESSSTTVL